MLDDRLNATLKRLVIQWNIAETRIKKAEHVQGGEIVASAIFELRYAGRKIIDVIDLVFKNENWRQDENVYRDISAFLDDAVEDCVKAKHDAIDAMMTFVTGWFDSTERRLKLSKIQHFFPTYIETTAKIFDIQEKIAKSRGDRNTLRDLIYNEIEKDDYNAILGLYETMKLSKERVEAEAKREARNDSFLKWVAIIGTIAGLIGVVDIGMRLFGL
jgi:hypothetical protein